MLNFLWTFFYVGAINIGGGLAAIPVFYQEMVQRGYILEKDFYNIISISESTPGPLGINIATYIGYERYGIFGALIGTLAIIIPSMVYVFFISKIFEKFSNSKLLKDSFYGIRAIVAGIITYSIIGIVKNALIAENGNKYFDYKALLGMTIILILYMKYKGHIIKYIGAGVIMGLIFYGIN